MEPTVSGNAAWTNHAHGICVGNGVFRAQKYQAHGQVVLVSKFIAVFGFDEFFGQVRPWHIVFFSQRQHSFWCIDPKTIHHSFGGFASDFGIVFSFENFNQNQIDIWSVFWDVEIFYPCTVCDCKKNSAFKWALDSADWTWDSVILTSFQINKWRLGCVGQSTFSHEFAEKSFVWTTQKNRVMLEIFRQFFQFVSTLHSCVRLLFSSHTRQV